MTQLIDFYADWCGPCKIMAPVFEELSTEYKDRLEFKRINVEVDNKTSAKYEVSSIPTFVIVKDGKEISRKVGAQPKDILKTWIDSNL